MIKKLFEGGKYEIFEDNIQLKLALSKDVKNASLAAS